MVELRTIEYECFKLYLVFYAWTASAGQKLTKKCDDSPKMG